MTDFKENRSLRVQWAKINPSLSHGLGEPKKLGDVGHDLEAAEDVTIYPGEACDVSTNVRIALPEGYWAEIRARSSMIRRNIFVDPNVIDTGYRGPLFAQIRNVTQLNPLDLSRINGDFNPIVADSWALNNAIQIERGMRLAQVVFHVVSAVDLLEVDEIPTNTGRGEAGFGSTGV